VAKAVKAVCVCVQYSYTAEAGRDPSQHPCLLALPTIFLKAMRGLAAHVDAFLGQFRQLCFLLTRSGSSTLF
jgi:hypothetical protein